MRATAGILLALCAVAAPLVAAPPAAAGPEQCDNAVPGLADPAVVPWVQARLDFDRVGRVATGAGVTVAVIDSGLDEENPQVKEIQTRDRLNVLPAPYARDDIRDCVDVGHGTGVSAIIAAPAFGGIGFVGLAPEATIMPIKFADPDTPDLSDADTVAAGIEAAIAADVDVLNLSLTSVAETPRLRAAVLSAKRADIVVVAASGNEGATDNRAGFPAEYAAEDGFGHVLAVAATDEQDQVASFSTSGPFVSVAAPGTAIQVPTPKTGYTSVDGTSFATPFVSATVALVRERHPELRAIEVVTRIEATADRPGVQVPDPGYGYGIVNPYLAVTAERDDSRRFPVPQPLPAAPAPDLPSPPDRTLQNRAYAVAAGLLGATGIFAVGAVAWRRTTAERRRTTVDAAGPR